ncbi:MAG: DUF3604 domain-containing protein [Halioglobus sp.]
MHQIVLYVSATLLILFAAGPQASATPHEPEPNPLRNVYFGETHVHTAYSLDAYLGGTRLTPSDAYRHAKGEAVVVNGKPHRLRRPLDFAAVTDHAEYLGEMYAALHPGSPGSDQPQIKELVALTAPADRRDWFLKYVISNTRGANPQHLPFYPGDAAVRSGWEELVNAANAHYQPGEFTTFPAFEWSSAPGGGNLHRNILFRSSQVPDIPVSSFEIPREEALWDWLAKQNDAGARAVALPHNSNASKGLMFPDQQSDGRPLDERYARQRSKFERAIEIMQIKGNSEVHANFWAGDEFSDFENAPSMGGFSGRVPQKRNFVRDGLVRGLALQAKLGGNPYKLGLFGGTDSHNGVMGDTEEDNWAGGHGFEDGTPQRRQTAEVGGWLAARDQSPGSLAGAWATSNTREAIWDSIYNREVFATSGTRIRVRLFGSWNYPQDLHERHDRVAIAYRDGVPMGGDLQRSDMGDAPRFLVAASKDPLGANLDRIQIIKGWIDAKGNQRDKVFDVNWSGDRQLKKNGKLPAVGNTVDVKTATYRNSIGSSQLATVWQDPEFDPSLPALYYARVIEIPTPRWTTYDAVRAGLPLPKDAPATISERAWSSPIWYTP